MFGGTSGWCRRRAVPAATILALITTAGLVVSPAQVSAASTTNLGVSTWESRWTALDGGGAAFIVRESDEGNTDLNADGDGNDFVLHRWDPDTGVTNLEISVGTSEGPVALDGGGIAVLRRSPSALIVVDDAGAITDLGVVSSYWGGLTPLDGGGLAFPVDESSTYGVGADLNGDGDKIDFVMHVWEPAIGATNLGVATGEFPVALDGGGVSFIASEAAQGGTDLNGDGGAVGSSLHVWDPVNGVTNLGIDPGYNFFAAFDGGGIAFTVTESSSDLNGDGDVSGGFTGDKVVHVWDPSQGISNLGLAAGSERPVVLDGGGLAFTVSEALQGSTDLNGDGFAGENVVHLWDSASGTTNLGIASRTSSFSIGVLVALDGGGLALSVPETGSDLNGDGDQNDFVVHVWDNASGFTSLGLAGGPGAALEGGGMTISVSEAAQAITDLNGDGDTNDLVLHVWDPATGVSNLGLAGGGKGLVGGRLAFSVSESAQGATDLNGDGDTFDRVAHVWDPAGSSPEVCDGIDNDQNGTVDDGVTINFYADTDGDGYGDVGVTAAACSAPAGYVINSDDADDGDDTVYPGAAELDDGKDNDQDGTVDEGLDGDGDGFTPINGGDADDTDPTVYPGAAELCDGKDNDQNGTVDDGVTIVVYADADGDGFGDVGVTAAACSVPAGFVANSDDADDGDDTVYPGAPELDDGKDNDQDGVVDEGLDGDGDGFTPVNGGDADDTDPTVYPGAAELCDGEDNDQDGTVDEGWPDADGDTVADCVDVTQTVAFVAGNSTGAPRDQPAIGRLRSMGLDVTVIDDNVVSASAVAGFDLVVLSSSVVPSRVGTKLTNVAVPIVTWEGNLFDELKLTTKGSETSTAQTRVTIVSPAHPVAAGLSGTVRIMATAKKFNQAAVVAAGVTVVATTVAGKGTTLAADTGDALISGVAPARRVTLPWNYDGPAFTNANGWALYEAAVEWALD